MCVSDQTKARQNDRIVSWEVLSPNIIHLAVFEKKNNITLLYSVLPYLKVGLTKTRWYTYWCRKDTSTAVDIEEPTQLACCDTSK